MAKTVSEKKVRCAFCALKEIPIQGYSDVTPIETTPNHLAACDNFPRPPTTLVWLLHREGVCDTNLARRRLRSCVRILSATFTVMRGLIVGRENMPKASALHPYSHLA